MFLTFWLYLQKITTKETTASAVGPKVMMFLIRGERVGAIKVGHLQAQAHLAIWKGYLISIHQFFPLRNSIIFHFKIVPIFLHPPILFQRLFCRGSWVNRDIFYSSEICRGLNFRHAQIILFYTLIVSAFLSQIRFRYFFHTFPISMCRTTFCPYSSSNSSFYSFDLHKCHSWKYTR